MSKFSKLKLVFCMIKFPRWNFSSSNFPCWKNSSWKNPSSKNKSWKNQSSKNKSWKNQSSKNKSSKNKRWKIQDEKNPRKNRSVGMGPRWNIPPLVHWGPAPPPNIVVACQSCSVEIVLYCLLWMKELHERCMKADIVDHWGVLLRVCHHHRRILREGCTKRVRILVWSFTLPLSWKSFEKHFTTSFLVGESIFGSGQEM